MLVIQVQFIDNGFHNTFGIIGIIYGEIVWVTYFSGFGPEDTGKYAMESANIQVPGFCIPQCALNALLHFCRCFIGVICCFLRLFWLISVLLRKHL